MAKPEQVQDENLRALLTEAREAYLSDRNADCMQKAGAAFEALLRQQPTFLDAPARHTSRLFMQLHPPFPAHLGLSVKGAGTAEPQVVLEQPKYTNSEAITFYEYVSDCLVEAKL